MDGVNDKSDAPEESSDDAGASSFESLSIEQCEAVLGLVKTRRDNEHQQLMDVQNGYLDAGDRLLAREATATVLELAKEMGMSPDPTAEATV